VWHDLAVAVCLVLVIEGILPFLNPGAWRRAMAQAVQLDNRSVRLMGLASMIIGTLLLYLVN
jgi:hypothetical protein